MNNLIYLGGGLVAPIDEEDIEFPAPVSAKETVRDEPWVSEAMYEGFDNDDGAW